MKQQTNQPKPCCPSSLPFIQDVDQNQAVVVADGIWPKVCEGRGKPELMDLAVRVHAYSLFPRNEGMSQTPSRVAFVTLFSAPRFAQDVVFSVLVETCIGVREMSIKVSRFDLEFCARISLYIS